MLHKNLIDSESFFDADVKTFCAVYETRSFSDAARLLSLRQPAVSKHISNLEKRLGFPLFYRSERPVRASAEAGILYEEITRHALPVANTVRALQNRNFIKPYLRLGCVESISLPLLPRLIRALLPKVSRISQITVTSDLLLELLFERKIDMFFASLIPEDASRVRQTRLFSEPSVILAPSGLKLGPRPSWEDLKLCGLPYLRYSTSSGGGNANERYLSGQGVTLPQKIEVDFNSVMVTLIAQGLGWTIGRPSTVLQMKDAMKGVAVLPMPAPMLTRSIYLVAARDIDPALYDECEKTAGAIFNEEILPRAARAVPWARPYLWAAKRG